MGEPERKRSEADQKVGRLERKRAGADQKECGPERKKGGADQKWVDRSEKELKLIRKSVAGAKKGWS